MLENQHYSRYVEERSQVVKKEKLAIEVHLTYNEILLDFKGYFAYGNEDLKTNAHSLYPEITRLIKELEEVESNDEDRNFNRELRQFTDYYFLEIIPKQLTYYESGQLDELSTLARNESTPMVKEMIELATTYNESINGQLDSLVTDFMNRQKYVQIGLGTYMFLILLMIAQIIRMMSRQIGQPLGRLAYTAEQISNGEEVELETTNERHDELGALSTAFNKMIKSIQQNEQNLLAQNEELIAQQDELHSQQTSLEEALEIMAENEEKQRIRNDLVNGISNSLNKQEVLDSTIQISKMVGAERGLIVMLDDDNNSFGAFGVSEKGVSQFKHHMHNGFLNKLFLTKDLFTVNRELDIEDRGYHESKGCCYDLYLPILSTDKEIMAIIVLSRFGGPFPRKDYDDYRAIAKHIGLTLEKIRLYEETENNRQLNQNILNTIQEAILLVDVDGTILQINEKFRGMIPESDYEDLLSLPLEKWLEILKKDVTDQEAFQCFFKQAVSHENTKTEEEFMYQKQDGQVYKVYCESQFQDGEKVGTVIVHRDITKEYEVDRIKSEFVSTVSHELRTPLASILGFTELLLNRKHKEERQEKYLTTIYNEGKRLTSLINDFLDVQRMESGKQTYEKKYVELLPIVKGVIKNQRIQTSIHQITWESSAKSGMVIGDRSKLEQVFTNLIGNAIKYSPNGGEIKVKIYEEKGFVKVDIQDEGLGIPEEAIDKLFTRFFRIDNSDRRRIGGTGLGLSIVKEIMKAHDGEVTISSVYGKGSTFTISFPMISKDSTESSLTNKGLYKVLVVEDDQSLADLICEELNENGFEVIHLNSGKAVLQFLEKEIPDAIVLDILLEDGIDGWTILEHLKEHEKFRHIPVIVSTAIDDKEKGFALGADDFLVKPYKPSQLSRAIMQTILKMGKKGQILIPENE